MMSRCCPPVVMEDLKMVNEPLCVVFDQIPDPRNPSGRRHPLSAILTLAAVAMLSGARSLESIAQFARDRGDRFTRLLGFTRDRPPCKATFHNVFKALDTTVFERAISRWLRGRRASGWEAIAIDGKCLCGTQGDQLPGVHLLAAYEHEAQAVIGQMAVDATTNEHKAALALLDLIDVEDATVTGDAMFCQRDLSQKILDKKGITSGRSRATNRNSKKRLLRRSRANTTRGHRRVNAG